MNYDATLFDEKLKRIYEATQASSESALARILKIKPPSVSTACKRRKIPPVWIEKLADQFNVSADWLFFGRGEMRPKELCLGIKTAGSTSSDQSEHSYNSVPVSVIALGACSITGWHASTNVYLTASPPVITEKMFGVLSVGDSMVPAGICEGQLLYCDPESKPSKGDAVFIRQNDDTASVKLYIDENAKNIYLRGWLSPDKNGVQKPYTITAPKDSINTLAPVLYTKRRIF